MDVMIDDDVWLFRSTLYFRYSVNMILNSPTLARERTLCYGLVVTKRNKVMSYLKVTTSSRDIRPIIKLY